MKTKTLIVIFILLSIMVYKLSAQNKYAIEVVHDKKVIHPELLNLPNSTTIYKLLSILPEMSDRLSNGIFTNFVIQIQDVSIEESRNIILSNLKIEDVKEIEITDSPISSFENGGQGGVINITLKNSTEKFSGNISSSFYNSGIIPMLNLGLNYNKVSVKAIVAYQAHSPKEEHIFMTETAKSFTNEYINKLKDDPRFQMARIYICYKPTEKDIFNFCISDNYTKYRNNSSLQVSSAYDSTYLKQKQINLRANTKYEHIFNNRGKFLVELNYNYIPGHKYILANGHQFDNNNKSHCIAGKVEYSIPLSKKISFFVGTNYNITTRDSYNAQDYQYFPDKSETYGETFYLSPYLRTDCTFGKFSVKAVAEYQFYQYRIHSLHHSKRYNIIRNDLTGKLALGWQFNPHNKIRLYLDRKLKRPTDNQVYPYFTYSDIHNCFVYGNSYLTPMFSNEIKLEYITDIKAGLTDIIVNGSASYIRTDKIIQSATINTIPYEFITYYNYGNNDIGSCNLMFYLRRDYFSLSFTGNLYFNQSYSLIGKDYYNYYNLSLSPSLFFGKGWYSDIGITYNSSVHSSTYTLGNNTILSFKLGKSWKKWQVFGYGQLPIDGMTKDIKYSSANIQSRIYYPIAPRFGLEARFQF